MKIYSIARDYKEFFHNIKNGEIGLIFWKTKEFIKRFYKNSKLILRHIWLELKKIGRGFKLLHKDVKYSIKTTMDTSREEYGSYSFTTRVKIRRTWSDVFKFIPFSILIIVPGLDLLIPPYLMIFPNALPSQFQSESAKAKKMGELVQLQKISAEKLSRMFPQRLAECLQEREVDPVDKKKIIQLKSLFKDKEMLTTELLEYREIFVKYINFRYAPTNAIMTASNLMSLQPVTGINTLNNILKLFRLQIPIDHPTVHWMTRRILVRELFLYMKKLRKDDSILRFDEIEELDNESLDRLCFERGLPISILNRNQKLRELK